MVTGLVQAHPVGMWRATPRGTVRPSEAMAAARPPFPRRSGSDSRSARSSVQAFPLSAPLVLVWLDELGRRSSSTWVGVAPFSTTLERFRVLKAGSEVHASRRGSQVAGSAQRGAGCRRVRFAISDRERGSFTSERTQMVHSDHLAERSAPPCRLPARWPSPSAVPAASGRVEESAVLNESADVPPVPTAGDAASPLLGVSEQSRRGGAGRLDVLVSDGVLGGEQDLSLLRAYEPVIRYTRGELFFPTAVGGYVRQCGLWAAGPRGDPTRIVPAGELTLERLCEEGLRHRDRRLFLRFVAEPLGHAEYVRWRLTPREQLSHTGRFTTAGVFGRLIDAGLRASLLLRGKVPAGWAAAAETTYRERLQSDRFTYYGRVVRDGGYVCLQYWFFYAMNDWRSTFGGINDHEGDWEMITLYLAEHPDGSLQPLWAAFSSHDYYGDDLRRRWDDRELHRTNDRVVAFAGAGSHSGAFIPGDYVVLVDPPRVEPAFRFLRKLQRLLAPWRHYTGTPLGLGLPFLDYARGDGVAIGPGHDAQWTPVLIDDETPWVRDYRGLWGLDTGDRFGGERAPSGPRYERDGSVRASWANPLGWAGLLKVAPDEDAVTQPLAERISALEREIGDLDARIDDGRTELRGLRAQARSLRTHDYARALAEGREAELVQREAALNQMVAARTSLDEERRAHVATLGEGLSPEAPEAHIRRAHRPYLDEQDRRTRFLKLWAAVSTPLLLCSVILVLVVSPLALVIDIAVLACVFIGVEAVARRRFLSFLASLVLLAVVLALGVGLIVLFLNHWRIALSLVIGVGAVALLIANLRAIRHN